MDYGQLIGVALFVALCAAVMLIVYEDFTSR